MPYSFDPWLVALSVGVAILVSFTSLGLASRVAQANHALARVWLLAGAVSMGAGIWSMHFIGMLAFTLPIELRYDVRTTVASLAVAVATSGFAIGIASRPTLRLGRHVLASLVMGLGIVTMHYMGMRALRIFPGVQYRPPLVAASAAIAVLAAFAALGLTFKFRSRTHAKSAAGRLGAAIVMGLAIAGMHYTGMAAAEFQPGAFCRGGVALDDRWLVVAVIVTTLALLIVTLISSLFDAHLEARAHLHSQRLQLAQGRLIYHATHDALTKLPNRTQYVENLRRSIADSATTQKPLAVILVDLDRFKPINDSLGHGVGDGVLQEVAVRLRGQVSATGTVARLGADEFLVLDQVAGARDVLRLADHIVHRLAEPYVVQSFELHLAASVGITTFPFDHSSADVLISHADEAMYEAKRHGGNGYRIFVPGTTVYTTDRIQLENDLWHAAERGELQVHYQPQVHILTGRILGLEALARWRHPVRGWVSPQEFIPLAEASDIILHIGRWILEQVCRQIRSWHDEGLRDLSVAVNLSARQFRQPDLVGLIKRALDRNGLEPRHLKLEVTESMVMSDFERALETLEQLNHAGLQIAVDDFGTGHSSLSYLKRLPVNYLKIDRSFVNDLGTDSASDAIVRAIITLGQGLGMTTIAEGVENARQLLSLRSFGCDQYQGFLYSRPCAASDILALLRRSPEPLTDGVVAQSILGSAR